MHSPHGIPLQQSQALNWLLNIAYPLFDFGKELSYLSIHALCYQLFPGIGGNMEITWCAE